MRGILEIELRSTEPEEATLTPEETRDLVALLVEVEELELPVRFVLVSCEEHEGGAADPNPTDPPAAREDSLEEEGAPLGCPIEGCDWSGDSIRAVGLHLEESHPEKPEEREEKPEAFACDHPGCDFVSPNKGGLGAHKRSHENRRVSCPRPDCMFTAKNHAGVASHRRTHRDAAGRWPCWFDGCAETFANKYALDEHIRKHEEGEIPDPASEAPTHRHPQEIEDSGPPLDEIRRTTRTGIPRTGPDPDEPAPERSNPTGRSNYVGTGIE